MIDPSQVTRAGVLENTRPPSRLRGCQEYTPRLAPNTCPREGDTFKVLSGTAVRVHRSVNGRCVHGVFTRTGAQSVVLSLFWTAVGTESQTEKRDAVLREVADSQD